MNAAIKSIALSLLTGALRKLGAAASVTPASAVAPSDRIAALTGGHLSSLGTLLSLIPVNDLIAIAEGHATWDNVLDAAEHGADMVRLAFPPAAMTAYEVKLGLEALQFVLDLAGVGPTPFHIEPGQNPIRGGWSGARGHI